MKIGQYCQRQRCRHAELKQFRQAFASRGFVSDSWAFLLLYTPYTQMTCCFDISSWFIISELVLGLRELPYWSSYSKPRLILHIVVSSKYFDLSISGIIGLNVITMALEFHMMPTVSHHFHIIPASEGR